MSESLEIERKFLVRVPPDLDGCPRYRLRQGYIATGETEVRLRSDGENHCLTCKRGEGMTREEQEVELSREQFDQLWPLTQGSRIDKTRYHLEDGDLVIELDVYHGSLEPLVVAEVEFDTVDAGRRFEVPDFFGREVTDDRRYKNKVLAREGVPR